MAEWFKAAVLKTAFLPGNGGSNPSPSAMNYVRFMAALNSTVFRAPPKRICTTFTF